MYRDNLFDIKEATINLTETISHNELACLANGIFANMLKSFLFVTQKKYFFECDVCSNGKQKKKNNLSARVSQSQSYNSARVVKHLPL
jgi:hypothetical protein